MNLGDLLVPLASFEPLQSHLDPPCAPNSPKVSIWDAFWGYFGVTLDLMLVIVGVFSDA
jgi:hypothetical protein